MHREHQPQSRPTTGSGPCPGRRARSRRTPARLAVAAAFAVGVLGPAAPAGAHVTITPSTTDAGAHAILEVSLSHGCDGSPTTEVAIQIPEGIDAVAPTRHPLWEVEKQVVALDPPVTDSHGGTITERVASVTYRTDRPLPDGHRDTFELSVQLPEDEVVLAFPTIQTCVAGESAWTEVPVDGEDTGDLALPAPTVAVTAAETTAPGEAGAPASAASTLELAESTTSQEPRATGALVGTALAAGLLGVLLGGAALVLHRRRT